MAHFEELLQDLLQTEFQIPEAYGMDTVINEPQKSACFEGVSLGAHNERTMAARSLIF